MKIQGNAQFAAPPDRVWDILLDPEIIAQCMPGCESLEQVDTDTYTARLKIGVGAVSGTYEGNLRIHQKVAPSRYSMVFEGGGSQGFVKGAGQARLFGENGRTRLAYDCDVEVGGLIASVGQRVLQGVSRYLIGQMLTRLSGFVSEEEKV